MTEVAREDSSAVPLKAGDTVRIKRPEGLLASFAKKVVGRRATLRRTYLRAGEGKATAVVLFHKRAGRGKEFEEHMALDSICRDSEV